MKTISLINRLRGMLASFRRITTAAKSSGNVVVRVEKWQAIYLRKEKP